MKKLIIGSLISVITMLLLISCETDYQGTEPDNQPVTIGFYETSDTISNQTTRVRWYANDPDGYNLKFKYLVSSNLDLNNTSCLDSSNLSDDEVWFETDESFADVAFPFVGQGAYIDTIFLDSILISLDSLGLPDTTYIDTVFRERLDSKIFLYAVDQKGIATGVISKQFSRENRKPN